MRITFVVQRYGQDVAGGAEALCRSTARALAAAGEEVVVHTTTARDYLTWAPHYPAGQTVEEGVTVHRHPVHPPAPQRAAKLVRSLALNPDDPDTEQRWALAQGPVAPAMLEALSADDHDVAAFWTYLYATTQLGLPLCRDQAILVPLAHDEPMLRFTLTRGLVRAAAGLAFMTPEEAILVDDVIGVGDRPACVVGTGLSPAVHGDPPAARARFALPQRFVLYLGRVDTAKGVGGLVRAHAAYRAAGGALGLVLAGRPAGELRTPDWVVRTGFVTDSERVDLIAAADAVVLPSRHESLSLVALEAWQQGRPTIATERSEVLAGQTGRSGAGLLYRDARSYAEALRRLEDPALRDRLARAGPAFTAGLTWDACVARWRDLAERVVAVRAGRS